MKVLILLTLVATIQNAEDADDKMKFCALRLTTTTCSFCWVRKLISGLCEPPTNSVTKCVNYTVDDKCALCDQGRYLNNNVCTTIPITKCSIIAGTNTSTCTGCFDGIKPVNGKCDSTEVCPSNCFTCSSAGVCALCKGGYVLGTDLTVTTCIKESDSVDNCAGTFTGAPKICLSCLPNYYMKDVTDCKKNSDINIGFTNTVNVVSAIITSMYLVIMK